MTQPVPVGGGSFDVDITRAPEAIRELQGALEELRSIRQEATQLGHVDPPTNDLVSRDAAHVLGLKATGGPGSLQHALEAGIAELERMILSLREGFAAYEEADDAANSGLSISS
ncbi:PE domain-containing protein [Actinomycetospora lutea]|uniref:PE domain-containing protein n=1 Tax=Actinomycetospora lutea TaxID=663604 RepID=UPI00236524E5|nr:PE domain-containing protein [Actinomycetospora lutea]MDD7939279.1 PE domain-containing protein [Actinomycetospora lutea]